MSEEGFFSQLPITKLAELSELDRGSMGEIYKNKNDDGTVIKTHQKGITHEELFNLFSSDGNNPILRFDTEHSSVRLDPGFFESRNLSDEDIYTNDNHELYALLYEYRALMSIDSTNYISDQGLIILYNEDTEEYKLGFVMNELGDQVNDVDSWGKREVKYLFALSQLGKNIDDLHKRGIFHRDIKPENILIDDDSLYLIDWGIALVNGDTQNIFTSKNKQAYYPTEGYISIDEYAKRERYAFGLTVLSYWFGNSVNCIYSRDGEEVINFHELLIWDEGSRRKIDFDLMKDQIRDDKNKEDNLLLKFVKYAFEDNEEFGLGREDFCEWFPRMIRNIFLGDNLEEISEFIEYTKTFNSEDLTYFNLDPLPRPHSEKDSADGTIILNP
jgi:serine/threonine protein kinase